VAWHLLQDVRKTIIRVSKYVAGVLAEIEHETFHIITRIKNRRPQRRLHPGNGVKTFKYVMDIYYYLYGLVDSAASGLFK
jgi:hypothetical protein